MSLGTPSSALYINAPGLQKAPTSIRLSPAALLSILDSHLRKPASQQRVIGALLGVRTETEVEIRTSFAVLHSESENQAVLDEEYYHNMLDVTLRGLGAAASGAGGRESVIGWYSTGGINSYSGLFGSWWAAQVPSGVAVHLVVNVDGEEGLGVKAYLGSPMGVSSKPDNCNFVPVPVYLRQVDAERPGLNLLRTAAESSNHSTPILTDLRNLEESLLSVVSMIEKVQAYVKEVITGERKGDAAIGRYLLDVLGTTTEGLGAGGFNSHIQDTLMVSYLANLVRSQTEVATRLTLVT